MSGSKKNLRSIAAVILNDSKDKVLLIKRRDVPVWVLPGGGVEQGEDPEAAVVREGREETGLEIKIFRKTAVYTPINRLSNETHVFDCRVSAGVLATGDETSDLQFFPLGQLPDAFFFVHRDWLEDALKNEQTVIHKPLTQVTYAALFKYFCRHPVQVVRFLFSLWGVPINS